MQTGEVQIGRYGNEYIMLDGTEHVALYAKTRSGKTTGFVVPNCLMWPYSLVVLDIRGEVFRATAGYRHDVLDQDIYLLDPASRTHRSHRWNPLEIVQRNSEDRFDQISRVAYMLFPDGMAGLGATNTDKFWEPAGRMAYTAVTTLVAETPELSMDQETILRMFARGDGTDVITKMIKSRRGQRGTRRQYSQTSIDGISDYLSGNLEQVEGIRKTVSTRLAPWHNHRIAAATSHSDFDLRDLRRKPMTVYVVVSPADMTRLRPYLALFFEQLVNLNVDVTDKEDPTITQPVLVMLDEFARLGRMQTVAEAAQFSAGYGLRFAYVVQNKAQLRAIYGEASSIDIFDNTGAEIVFGTNDLQTTKEVSERFGDDTAVAITDQSPKFFSSLQWQRRTKAEHLHRRPGRLPQEVARLGSTRQIVLRAGMQPIECGRLPWYKDEYLYAMRRPPPEIPLLNWSIADDDGQTRVLRPKPRNIGGLSEEDNNAEG